MSKERAIVFQEVSPRARENILFEERYLGHERVTHSLVRNTQKLVEAAMAHLEGVSPDHLDEIYRTKVWDPRTKTIFMIEDIGVYNDSTSPIRKGLTIKQLGKEEDGSLKLVDSINLPNNPRNITTQSIAHIFDIRSRSIRKAARMLKRAEKI